VTITKRITINASSAVIQVVFTALLYFFLYKYLLEKLGAEQLGVWSLILSFSSIANLANFGMTSGLVKFVAEYLAENKEQKNGELVLTSFISSSVLFFVMGIIVFFMAKYFLHWVIDEKFLTIAFQILPFSLASLCLNAVSGNFTSVLEGFQKNYLRNFLYIFSSIVMLVFTLILTPIYQLKGVAMAQVAQALVVFLGALVLMFYTSAYNRFSYWKWSTTSFKELFNYGYKFQIVSICQLSYEPMTKILLSKFGGLALLGHYEMATRLVNQVRALLVNANQVIIPVVAETAKIKTKENLQGLYRKMNKILVLFALPVFSLLLVSTPLISLVWIGSFNIDFVFSMVVLTFFTLINVLSCPAYFSCLAEGNLTILVYAHFGMALLNLAVGCLFGIFLSGYGVILAWGGALLMGSIILIYNYGKKISVNYCDIFSKDEKSLFLIFFLIIGINFCIFKFTTMFNTNAGMAMGILTILLYVPALLKNETVRYFIKGKK
jgi:O-antigen/teichoic acid export membrane protein